MLGDDTLLAVQVILDFLIDLLVLSHGDGEDELGFSILLDVLVESINPSFGLSVIIDSEESWFSEADTESTGDLIEVLKEEIDVIIISLAIRAIDDDPVLEIRWRFDHISDLEISSLDSLGCFPKSNLRFVQLDSIDLVALGVELEILGGFFDPRGHLVDGILSGLSSEFGVLSKGLHHLEVGSLLISNSCGNQEFWDKIDLSFIISSCIFEDSSKRLLEVLDVDLILGLIVVNIGGGLPIAVKLISDSHLGFDSINSIAPAVSVVGYDCLPSQLAISLLISFEVIDEIEESFFLDNS